MIGSPSLSGPYPCPVIPEAHIDPLTAQHGQPCICLDPQTVKNTSGASAIALPYASL